MRRAPGTAAPLGVAVAVAFAIAAFAACASSVVIGTDDPPDATSGIEAGGPSGVLDATPDSALPPLPPLANVVLTPREDSVGIDFDPVDDAVDYRVYPLPADGDVTLRPGGTFAIRDAVYRCAGLRQANDLPNDLSNDLDAPDAGQAYANGPYSWTAHVGSSPTLGYVYAAPAADRLPVYAVAGYTREDEVGWRESRLKVYTTDAARRRALLDQGWRDDGVAFYVPAAPSAATQTVYSSQTATVVAGQGWTSYARYYFGMGDLPARASDETPPSPEFQVLAAPGAGTQPLMAVLYDAPEAHVELAVGKARFRRASAQGAGPLWHLEWSGLVAPTILVVEALASGCPYPGFVSPQAVSAPPHQPFETLDALRTRSPSGEVFVNGQYDPPGAVDGGAAALQTTTAVPRPIARTFLSVAPQPHDPAAWDFYEGFGPGSDAGAVTFVPTSNCFQCLSGSGPVFDLNAGSLDVRSDAYVFAFGQVLGQLWDAFDDFGSGTAASVRFAARQKGAIDPDPTRFLHVTWSVNTAGTGRRYPQVFVSDADPSTPAELADPTHDTLLFQTIGGPAMRFELQAIHGTIDGNPWAINHQAPAHQLVGSDYSASADAVVAGADPPFEHSGVDRMTRFDVYVSSDRVYTLLDGAPAGCALYPAGFALRGPVGVTFADVLFHEGAADELVCAEERPYPFFHEHQCTETARHWDDLGFKSGVAAPPWDEARWPCQAY